ncbi:MULTISPECIES: ImmA/IrrE family metallo-endopeptidase [Helcococcus]|uniref:ImmA/IrrE family metallo-endopeptidase n=1 Tax=Helcococcus bovis TaxID=3153252 RepID=A0ABW9F724_9FIRM
MIKRKWIDEIVKGIVAEVGNNNVYDIADFLNISIIKDNEKQNPILKSCDGFYLRSYKNKELIVIKDDLINEKQIIAHELGHALLHMDYDFLLNNKFDLNSKKEKEADYFACRLLFSDLIIEDGIETTEQLANILGIKEDNIKYLVK